jgi:hypothetical protein
MAGYNSARTIPTTLSWMNRKYVKGYYENQFRLIEATTNQKTPYFKFRFITPVSIDGSTNDYIRIFLPGSSAGQPFSPVNTDTNLQCQLLPADNA